MSKVFHGGGLDAAIARFGGERSSWMDLSTGINPSPYPLPKLTCSSWAQLPDKTAHMRLLEVARSFYNVGEGCGIVAANGTQALIELLPQVLDKGSVSIVSPTYGEHAHCWNKNGANVREVVDLDEVESGVCVVVNPNNPDCRVHSLDALLSLCERVSWLIVDEAFCDCMPEMSLVPRMPENAIVLKSFGKFFGLAGLRLGFAVCNREIGKVLLERIGPWAVSGPALEIGARALADQDWIGATRARLAQDAERLAKMLGDNGLEIADINPLFVYAKYRDSEAIYDHLAQRHILVRRFPDRPGVLRFGLCENISALDRLQRALAEFGNA